MMSTSGIVKGRQPARWWLAVALLALGASTAWAQTKKQHVEAEVQAVQTSRTKFERPKPKAVATPTFSADEVVRGVQKKMAKINDVLIGKLQRLIRITEDTDPEKPDLLFRVAELYAEKQRYYDYQAGAMDEKIFSARSAGEKASLRAQKERNQQEAKRWLLEAVRTYLEVANSPKYRKYPKMDEVLFYLAYMLQQVKREADARVFFQRLIKDHPQSKFIPDAYMSFGVYYFQKGDMDDARKIFDRVTQFPQSRVYGYAMYLKAWCWYNLTDYKRSLETFEQVVDLARKGKNKLSSSLLRDARMNMVMPYARIQPLEVGASRAYNYFKRFGGKLAPKMHERLAEVYWEMGKYPLSTQVYHELMRLFPTHQSLCNWQYNIVRNTISMGQKQGQVQELQRLGAIYEYAKTKKFLKPDKMEECQNNTQGMLRELATVWHKEAQKTQNHDTYALAQYLYREYITRFPTAKDAGIMTYYYGDLLWVLAEQKGTPKLWEDAANVFTRVVRSDPQGRVKIKINGKDQSIRNQAALAAVVAWQKALRISEEVDDQQKETRQQVARKKKKGKKGKEEEEEEFKPRPIPPKQQKMLAAFETYLKYVPQAEERIKIHYQKARIYYEANLFDKAGPIFAEISLQYKTNELAVVAANLNLNCLDHQKKYGEIETWVDRYLGMPELTKEEEFKTVLTKLKAGIEWKKCEEFEAHKQYREAAVCQSKLIEKYREDPRVPTLLHDIGVNFERVKLIGNAMRARQALVDWWQANKDKRPADPDKKGWWDKGKELAQKALFQLGQSYMELAYFEDAAKYFEEFAKKYGGEKEAPQALSTAVFFRRGLGQDNKAIDDSRDFVKMYGKRPATKQDAAAVEFSIGAIYESQKNWDKLVKHYNSYLREWGRHGGADREILAHVRIGEVLWRQSCPVAGVHGACIEVKRVIAGGKASLHKRKKGKKGKSTFVMKTQCGPETKSKITVHTRKPRLANEALKHFATALRLYANGKVRVAGKDPADKAIRESEMMYAVAQAKFVQAEAQYEKFLTIQVPTGLDFNPQKKKKLEESTKKFKKWLSEKSKVLVATSNAYQSVITLKQAHWAIAALARIGHLYQNFADQLYTAPIPKAPKAPAGFSQDEFNQMFVDSYCDQMSDQAEPLDRKATEGFTKCLDKSTELFWYNEWSGMCEQELYQLKPQAYPMPVEIRAQPGYVEPKLDMAKAIVEIK